jgi:ribose-phosphate pyrophosphokinase
VLLTNEHHRRHKSLSGNANRALAKEICHELRCDLGQAQTSRFSDGEFNFQIEENVRGATFSLCSRPARRPDSHLMELLVMLDAFRRSSAERLTAVLPYYGYGARQEGSAARADLRRRWWRT